MEDHVDSWQNRFPAEWTLFQLDSRARHPPRTSTCEGNNRTRNITSVGLGSWRCVIVRDVSNNITEIEIILVARHVRGIREKKGKKKTNNTEIPLQPPPRVSSHLDPFQSDSDDCQIRFNVLAKANDDRRLVTPTRVFAKTITLFDLYSKNSWVFCDRLILTTSSINGYHGDTRDILSDFSRQAFFFFLK